MSLQPSTPAPAILRDLLAQLSPSQDLSNDGLPIFVNFFRSDCPWCATEMPRWSDIYASHSKLAVHVIGVAVGDDSAASAAKFAEEKALAFNVVADPSGAFKAAFDLGRVPAVVAINGHGLVERTYEGATEQLRGILEQTLYALAHGTAPPEYDMIGNGCAP